MNAKDYFKNKKVKISDKDRLRAETACIILDVRLHTGLSQAKLAKKVGTKQPAIARIESGGMIPSLEMLQKIAKATKGRLILPKIVY